MQNIIIAIITSLISSVVFWIVFNAIPSIYKFFRIRPRVEEDINEIKIYLLFFIQSPFLISTHSASLYQSDIVDKKINLEDYENALYGKCLSEEDRSKEFEHRLLPIGEKLSKEVHKLDKLLDRIQRVPYYMTTKELLLLKEIGSKIHTYDYKEEKLVVDGVMFKTVNPSISYMYNNFFELYGLYHELQRICDSYLFLRRTEIDRYRIAKGYMDRKCWVAYRIKRAFLNKKYKSLIDSRYYYKHNNTNMVKAKIKEYLQLENTRLVTARRFLDFIILDEDYRGLLTSTRGVEEVQECINCLNSEKRSRECFEKRNLENKKIIHEMIRNAPKNTELDAKGMRALNKLFDGYQ